MSKVRGANPAAQRAADAAVAIEEQDVLAGLHDSHLGPRSADLNNSYASKESLSHARRSNRGGSRMILDPSSVPERQAYRLMISAFIPRPIAFVSTVSRSGIDNCAPFSYSMGVSSHPMVLGVSIGDRHARPKDTTRNTLHIPQ